MAKTTNKTTATKTTAKRSNRGETSTEPTKRTAQAKGRDAVVAAYTSITRRAYKLAAMLASSGLSEDAEAFASAAKEMAAESAELPHDFRAQRIGTRAFLPGEKVRIAEKYMGRFEGLIDPQKPLKVLKQAGNRAVCEQDGARVLISYFNLRNA